MNVKLNFAFLFAAAVALCSLPAFAASAPVGAVYTLNNSSSGNAVMIFSRGADGTISPAGMVATGGNGSGAGLGSQGGLAIDEANRYLFAVNAGSNSISVFKIQQNGLHLLQTVSSGGQLPISLSISNNVLYVLNDGGAVGGTDSIAGFSVAANGHLNSLVSGLPLSAASVGPAEISFNTEGNELVVTEKGTNNIDIFSLDTDGVAVGPTVVPSAGQTPYGFAFGKRDQILVSDAFGGGANAGAMSSYSLTGSTLRTVASATADKQSAPCWVVLTNDGQFAYTTNTASGTVSGYSVTFGAGLRLMNANGEAASTGSSSSPIDEAISNDNRYLYVLAPGTSNIQAFSIAWDGSLSPLTQVSGIPGSASGLIAR